MESFKNFINELGDLSGDYIAKAFANHSFSVSYKQDSSPVTEIDKNTEEMIREKILKKFPDHGIIGEEHGNSNPDSEFTWVIDPIDGTKSFISGVPLFGTLVALLKDGKPVVGMINQPVLKERMVGDCKTATFNGRKVCPSDKKDPRGATLLSSDTRHPARMGLGKNWSALENMAAIDRSWGDCYGYMLVCRGLAHIMADPSLEIWDYAALLPVLEGAGVPYCDWFGGKEIGKKGLVACCNRDMLDAVMRVLNA